MKVKILKDDEIRDQVSLRYAGIATKGGSCCPGSSSSCCSDPLGDPRLGEFPQDAGDAGRLPGRALHRPRRYRRGRRRPGGAGRMNRFAQLFAEREYRRYPVLEDARLVGQISRSDVLRALQQLAGTTADLRTSIPPRT